MYDLTGGARIKKLHERIDKQAALAHMPTLREPNIAAAYLYYDAQADDAALHVAPRPHCGRARRRARQPLRRHRTSPRVPTGR